MTRDEALHYFRCCCHFLTQWTETRWSILEIGIAAIEFTARGMTHPQHFSISEAVIFLQERMDLNMLRFGK